MINQKIINWNNNFNHLYIFLFFILFRFFLVFNVLYTVSPTGRFSSLQLLRKARPPPPIGSLNHRALSSSNRMASAVRFSPALPEERFPLIGRRLTLLSTCSVSWACPSLTWRRPPAQSYSFPGRISSCRTCRCGSRRSRGPRRRWHRGRRPARSWRWWWWGWGPVSSACFRRRCSRGSPQSLGSLWCPRLEENRSASMF